MTRPSDEGGRVEHFATIHRTNIPYPQVWATCACGWTGPKVEYAADARAHARAHERDTRARPAHRTATAEDYGTPYMPPATQHQEGSTDG